MQSWKIVRAGFTLSLTASALLIAALVYRYETELVLPVVVLFLVVGACGPWIAARGRRGRAVGPFVALAVVNLLLVVPEVALRVVGYRHESGIQFGYPRPRHFVGFDVDEELFWKLPASSPGVNALGFADDEVAVPKPEGAFRALFLGDSCTARGYPIEVEEMLDREPGARRFDSVILATSGYSSHQGLVLARRHVPTLQPDLVFVYYGWNDHWLAYGAPDAEKRVRPVRAAKGIRRSLGDLRLLQAIRAAVDALRGDAGPLDEVRVPIQRYEENLRAIRDIVAGADVPLVFVTAPTSHYALGVPRYLIALHYAKDEASVVRLHRAYNEIVRRVAASTGSMLLDLESEVSALEDPGALFRPDGIHFSERGEGWVARRIVDFLRERGLWTEPR